MNTAVFVLLSLAAIVLLLALRYLSYCRNNKTETDDTEKRAHCLVLAKRVSPLGTMAGERMCRVELLLDNGEKKTLRLTSLPLFDALSGAEKGTAVFRGNKLTDFLPDQ